MAEVLEVKRSGYYAWIKAGNKTKSDIQDEYFLETIRIEFKIKRESYGPRRLSKHLKQKGINIGWDRVVRLMKENNILPKTAHVMEQFFFVNNDSKLVIARLLVVKIFAHVHNLRFSSAYLQKPACPKL